MLLNELTWHTTPTDKDVLDGITTDPVPPAQIIPGDGLWNPKGYDQVSKMGITNEPAVLGPIDSTSSATCSHD